MTKLEQAARQLLKIAEGIQHGTDWNNGTHAKIYRPKFPAAITALREALAEPQITTPDVCGEVCARAKLCYGCNKDLEEANAKYAEQAEKEPVAKLVEMSKANFERHWGKNEFADWIYSDIADLFSEYAAPVRTKDLTDDEILKCDERSHGNTEWTKKKAFARAVIAADREKNK